MFNLLPLPKSNKMQSRHGSSTSDLKIIHILKGPAESFSMTSDRPVLPDPTQDLRWLAFRGAIQDIFAANAEAHPGRPLQLHLGASLFTAK
jgi:hypothetical protein